jgi:hypothetical protein
VKEKSNIRIRWRQGAREIVYGAHSFLVTCESSL